MANYVETTKIKATRFVPITSRYADSSVLYYTENKLLTYGLYQKKNIPTSSKDRYAVITKTMEYRPDLVSQQAYGTVDFWWKIMEANNLWDIWDFKAGTNIRIPDAIFG